MDSMRAIVQHSFGGPEVLEVESRPVPEPLPTEVRVRVEAAGVNPVDWKTRAGKGAAAQFGLPLTVGWDVTGVVDAVGLGVTRFTVGDPVFGMPWFPRPASGYAEFVTAPSRHFARRPDALPVEQAAGLSLAGLTAWQCLVDIAQVQPGQRVLIHAAAGGVGHLAVQIAKSRGAHVIGTASAAKHDLLAELGRRRGRRLPQPEVRGRRRAGRRGLRPHRRRRRGALAGRAPPRRHPDQPAVRGRRGGGRGGEGPRSRTPSA